MNSTNNTSKFVTILALITGFLLLIPLVAMQFTEVNWTLSDFIFAGILIFGTGLAYKLITNKSGNFIYRLAVGSALATGFLLIWLNGAVGIIGSEANPINLGFHGIIILGLMGAIISRFKPRGMAFTLFLIAFFQILITTIALIGGYYQTPPGSVMQILGINGFFTLLWIGSGLLFWNAVRK